jgi:hypothetical protein
MTIPGSGVVLKDYAAPRRPQGTPQGLRFGKDYGVKLLFSLTFQPAVEPQAS